MCYGKTVMQYCSPGVIIMFAVLCVWGGGGGGGGCVWNCDC